MAIDYKGLRNLLDSNPNQTNFAQTLAQQFLAPLFKKQSDISTNLTNTGSVGNNSNSGGGGTPNPEVPEAEIEAPQYREIWRKGEAQSGVYEGGTFNRPWYVSEYLDLNDKEFFAWKDAGKQTRYKMDSQDAVSWTLDERWYKDIEYLDNPIDDPTKQTSNPYDGTGTQLNQEQLASKSVLEYNYIDAKKMSEADLKNIEKYVSPTAAKGLRSLLDALYQGNVPADVLARMQKEGFDPNSEAFKLITQNPLDFKGVASYGGITTGFKAADLQSANRIDTKRILSASGNGEQFRNVVAQEISKVILSSQGAKRKGQSFSLDARFDENSEKQILAGLQEDLNKVARQSGKYGSGLTRYVADMYDSLGTAKGYQGSVASLAAGSGENLYGYRNRLARQQEALTPKSYLDSDSVYLRQDKFAQNTRSVVNGFLDSLNSPLSIGFSL